jgi:hypothetical protein
MYNAQITSVDNELVGNRITVYTDTLYEAEIYIKQYIGNLLDSRHITLQYMYDTMYYIFNHGVFIGKIEIELG